MVQCFEHGNISSKRRYVENMRKYSPFLDVKKNT